VTENRKLEEELRAAGYASYAHDNFVVISPNDLLFCMFKELGIRTLDEYRPKVITPEQWADHAGQIVPTFNSLYEFFKSKWCARFFLNEETGALGEGFVVASAHNGRMFKVKHGGEDCGSVPDKIQDCLEWLEKQETMDKELEVIQVLQKIIRSKHKVIEKKKPEPKAKAPVKVDEEAQKAWDSALTKEDSLDDQFARGEKAGLTKRMVNQVKEDLVKDYGVDEKAAMGRASKFVNSTMGKLFGEWKKNNP